MKKTGTRFFFGVIFFALFSSVYADPWFTGPLLAPAGKTIPKGHINFEPYVFYTENLGQFNRHWRLSHSPHSDNIQFLPIFSYGLTDRMDFQFSIPYVRNRNRTQTSDYIGDTGLLLGFQVMEQQESKWRPNLRITLQQILPTGRYERLNPLYLGTDSTGLGSYQNALGLNFQHLMPIYDFYLRTRFCLNFVHAQSVNIHGLSSYGGTVNTKGQIDPGNLMSADLAGELSITQHLVLVMEGYYFNRGNTHFTGLVGLNPLGVPGTIGHDDIQEFSMAPAIEYNFTSNYGIIAGAWFSTKGKDAPDFISTVIAFNAFW